MNKTAYLIVTDLHLSGVNMRGRYNYPAEIDYVIKHIIKTGMKYIEEGYSNVNLIFLGDIIDKSYKNLTKGIYANNIFVALKNIFSNIYSVGGNHEFSYYTDNPFWTLFTEIKSEKIQAIKTKSWQPVGYLDLIEVVDTLEDGNVIFHFNHNGTGVNSPIDGKVNIGLFHQDIICKDIIESMKADYAMEVFESKPKYFDQSNILYGYNHCFFGHMHKVYGHWTYVCDKTKFTTELYYLGSLGRTNHTEVSNDFLERDIPAVIIENGNFSRIENNKFNLMCREECVKEEVVLENKEVLLKKNEIKYALESVPETDEAIDNIKSVLTANAVLYNIFDDFLNSRESEFEHKLMNRVERVINGSK